MTRGSSEPLWRAAPDRLEEEAPAVEESAVIACASARAGAVPFSEENVLVQMGVVDRTSFDKERNDRRT